MLKVTWRSVRHHPARFVLSLVAVTLGVAFISGTFALRSMMGDLFDGIMTNAMTADVYVIPAGATAEDIVYGDLQGRVSDELAGPIEAVPGVRLAAPDYGLYITILGADETPIGNSYAPSMVMGLTGDPLYDGVLSEGREPTGPHEVGLDPYSAEQAGLALGDTTKIIFDDDIREVTLVGLYTYPAAFAGAVIAVMDEDFVRETFFASGLVRIISVYLDEGADPVTVQAAVAAILPADAGAEVKLGDDLRAEGSATIEEMVGYMSTMIFVFAAVALFVGGFIIANTFTMIVRQQMKEIAVLRAVGAGPAQVFRSILGQAAIVGVIGSALGWVLGYGLCVLTRVVVEAMGMEMGAIPVTFAGVAVSIALGIGLAVASAVLPARKAAAIPPVEAMREALPEPKASRRTRGLAGAALMAAGLAALVTAAVRGDGATVWLGAGAAGLVVGAIVAGPVLAPAVTRVLAWPFARLFDPAGKLARGNVARVPRRTANTAGALMVGMALAGCFTVLTWSMRAAALDVIEAEFQCDFMVQNQATSSYTLASVPDPAVAAIAALGDADAYTVRVAFGAVQAAGGATRGTMLVAGPEYLRDIVTATVLEGSLEDADGQAILFAGRADALGAHVGDDLEVTLAAGTPLQRSGVLEVGAVVESGFTGAATGLMVPPEWVDALLSPAAQAQSVVTYMVFVNVHDGADVAGVRQAIVDIVKPYYTIAVISGDDLVTATGRQINTLLAVVYGLLGLSLVIAILGIVNTLMLSVAERTREIGLLRAVGLGKGQLTGMIVVEAVLIALYGTLLGLALGVGIASVVPRVLESQGFTALAIPWPQLGLILAGAAAVGVLAALLPSRRANKIPVLEAIAYE
jgi:putative ABC transport system permease protein